MHIMRAGGLKNQKAAFRAAFLILLSVPSRLSRARDDLSAFTRGNPSRVAPEFFEHESATVATVASAEVEHVAGWFYLAKARVI